MNLRTNKEYKVVLDYGVSGKTRLLIAQCSSNAKYVCFKVTKDTSKPTAPSGWYAVTPRETYSHIIIDGDLDMYSVSRVMHYVEITAEYAAQYLLSKKAKKSTWKTFSKCFPDIIPIAAVLAL